MGSRSERDRESSAELLGRDTGRTRARTNKAEGQDDVQDAKTTDCAAKRGMKHQANQRRKMNEKKIRFPKVRPRKIEKQGSHFEANDDQQCAEDAIHG